jgi:hypothetical protein
LSVPDSVEAFGRAVHAQLGDLLGDHLIGSYFVESIALGGYVAGESDIDIVAVSAHPIPEDIKALIIEGLLTATMGCPTRGLELTLYRFEVVSSPTVGADFEVNINGGPRMAVDIHMDPTDQPRFWYVIDRAIAHRAGKTIDGPPPAELFADVDRDTLASLMAESMRWHRLEEGATLYSVLNAARA